MCRRSCRHARVCSPPGRAARPTPPTLTRWHWLEPGSRDCDRWSPTTSSRSCGCSPTDAAHSVRNTPVRCPNCTPCCSNSCLVGRRRTFRRRRPRRCWHGCDHATWSARHVAGSRPSWSSTSSRTTPAGRPRTRSSRHWWPRPAPGLLDLHGIGPSGPPGSWSKSLTSPGSPTATTSRPGLALPRSMPPPATTSATGCPAAATGRSTECCTSWPPSSSATPPRAAPTSTAPKADGKSSNEAMRCLKRRLSDIVYRDMVDDARSHMSDGPGRATGQRLCLQRDRLTTQHRLFGQATSRTRQHQPRTPFPAAS